MSALLEAASLSKTFFSEHNALPAVCNVSFSVAPGECLGLAGASGCGKSTLARLLMGLTPADSGTVSFNGQPLDFADAALRKNYYSQVQLVFQNAAAAFHPRKSIGSSIMLPMLNYGWSKAAARERSIALLLAAGLTPQHAEKFPHQLSGGECQRAAIARAISIKPRLLICVKVQRQKILR
jgi:oligopeptide transport system ATP-binding protein